MKNLAVLASLLVISTTSFAATTGNLTLRGSVALVQSIAITAGSGSLTLDLSTTQTDLVVASIVEKSNSNNGFKISVSSANAGKLLRTGGTEAVTYTMKYGGTAVSLASANDLVISSTAGVANNTKNISISYTGAAADTMVEGAYEDTVSFTIAAN